MKKTIFKTGLILFAIGVLSLVGFKAAYGYGGSGGGGSIPSCATITYGPWSECVNGVQYRNVIGRSPLQCSPTASQQLDRSKVCEVTVEQAPIINTPKVEGKILGAKQYAEGTLLRGSNGRIYVVTNNSLKHIVSLDDLKKYYRGRVILNVDNSVIVSFGQAVLGANKYAAGTLLRTPDRKIYVVVGNAIKRIFTLDELRRSYAGREILNVSDEIIKGLK